MPNASIYPEGFLIHVGRWLLVGGGITAALPTLWAALNLARRAPAARGIMPEKSGDFPVEGHTADTRRHLLAYLT